MHQHEQPGSGIDPTVELIIRQMMDHVDARLATLKAELKAELAAEFVPRHDELARRMTQVEDRVADGVKAIRQDTAFTKVLAVERFASASTPPSQIRTPQPGDPRPIQFDHVAAADQTEGAKKVALPEYGAVVYPKPGTDAEDAWTGASEAIRAGRGSGGAN